MNAFITVPNAPPIVLQRAFIVAARADLAKGVMRISLDVSEEQGLPLRKELAMLIQAEEWACEVTIQPVKIKLSDEADQLVFDINMQSIADRKAAREGEAAT